MAEEHWFDRVNKLLAHHAPRRGVVGTAVALTAARVFGASNVAGKADICAKTWPGKRNKKNRESCRRTRKTCKKPDNGPFCIVAKQIDGETHEIAKCCNKGEKCCGGDGCCPANRGCCGKACAPAPDDPELKCCGGKLYNTRINRDHCGACGNPCGAGEVCRDGTCVCDGPECVCHDRDCPPALGCVDGRGYLCGGQTGFSDCQCGCGPGLKHCPDSPVGPVCVSENSTLC
jgi:hypothetical protein